MNKQKSKKQQYGWTALLWSAEYQGWTEAYGYLGSYYKSYRAARGEINWLMRTYPEKYLHWRMQRIVVDENGFVDDPLTVVIAQSYSAPQ